MSVEILYLARNRLEFTKVSFGLLLEHTDWSLVDRLVVYDDGSKDGTREWLASEWERITDDLFPPRFDLLHTKLGSPVEVMIHYLARTDADVFAKIDSDIALPPGWLPTSLGVMERSPDLDLLGLAAGWTGVTPLADPRAECIYTYSHSSHIGGVGLMRTSVFRRYNDLWGQGRQGFTQWQHRHRIETGWITPDLPVVQLDLIPDEPWASLADYYVSKKWSREWPKYAAESSAWWSWIPDPIAA